MNPLFFKKILDNKDKIFNIKTFLFIIIGVLLCIILLDKCGKSRSESQNEALAKELLKFDKTIQETNVSYKKLVNNFNSERDLRKEVEKFNKELAKTIKNNNEKILAITGVVASFDKKLDKGINVTVSKDSTTGEKIISFVTRYPTNDNPNDEWFVQYKGKIYTESEKLDGEWDFNKLNFNIVLTEQENGMWATRIDGPSYFKADSIVVNALPKDKIANSGKFNLLLGAGYRTLVNLKQTGAVTLSGGFEYKKNIVLVDASTDQRIGVTFIRKFGKK